MSNTAESVAENTQELGHDIKEGVVRKQCSCSFFFVFCDLLTQYVDQKTGLHKAEDVAEAAWKKTKNAFHRGTAAADSAKESAKE